MSRDITAAARMAGVVGCPISHSLSPALHRAWIDAAGLDAVYIPILSRADRFDALVAGFAGSNFVGLNITAPFKAAALALADEADAVARRAGAANLLVFRDGRIVARNTDGLGLLAALDEQAPGWRRTPGQALVLGAGGAARGAVAALVDLGVPVRVASRTDTAAIVLAEEFPDVEPLPWSAIEACLVDVALVVNATTAGQAGSTPLEIEFGGLRPEATVMDMVYRPLETPLLAAARRHGVAVVDGLAMLIGQARPSFTALFGVEVPSGVDARALALRALGANEKPRG